jgi:hypothetical protein
LLAESKVGQDAAAAVRPAIAKLKAKGVDAGLVQKLLDDSNLRA